LINSYGFTKKTLKDEQLKAQKPKLSLLTHEEKCPLFFGNIASNSLKNRTIKALK
jgi:hypothetical protein